MVSLWDSSKEPPIKETRCQKTLHPFLPKVESKELIHSCWNPHSLNPPQHSLPKTFKPETNLYTDHYLYMLNFCHCYCFHFFIVIKYRLHKIYHFNRFSVQLSGITYTYIVVQPSPLSISRNFSSSQIETLDLLNNNSPYSPAPSPW